MSPRPGGRPEAKPGPWPWVRFYLGRVLQVAGLMITLVSATAFFGTPSTTAMLRMMLVGVAFFVPGWLLARRAPGATSPAGHEGRRGRAGGGAR